MRRAIAADAAIVRDQTRAAYAKWIPLIGREPKPMTANYERAVVEHIIDLYEEDDVPVALVEVIPQATCLLIENIAVQPSQQGKGLGDLLLKHAEMIAHLVEGQRQIGIGDRIADPSPRQPVTL